MSECCEGPAGCTCGLIQLPYESDDTVEMPAICGDCQLRGVCCRDDA